MDIFEKDKYVTAHALNMWANYIETGDVCKSSVDAINMGESDQVRALNIIQQEFVVRLRKLSSNAFSGKLNLTKED